MLLALLDLGLNLAVDGFVFVLGLLLPGGAFGGIGLLASPIAFPLSLRTISALSNASKSAFWFCCEVRIVLPRSRCISARAGEMRPPLSYWRTPAAMTAANFLRISSMLGLSCLVRAGNFVE